MRDLHGRERQDTPVVGEEGVRVAPRSGRIKEIANSEGDSVETCSIQSCSTGYRDLERDAHDRCGT